MKNNVSFKNFQENFFEVLQTYQIPIIHQNHALTATAAFIQLNTDWRRGLSCCASVHEVFPIAIQKSCGNLRKTLLLRLSNTSEQQQWAKKDFQDRKITIRKIILHGIWGEKCFRKDVRHEKFIFLGKKGGICCERRRKCIIDLWKGIEVCRLYGATCLKSR